MSYPRLEETRRPGLMRRLAAIFYDAFLVLALVVVAFTLVYLPLAMVFDLQDLQQYPLYRHLMSLYMLSIAIGFHLFFWTGSGQSLGMRAWRLKLVPMQGERIHFKQALIRYLVAILSFCCFGLGFLWVLFHPYKLSWHDLASGTYLVLVDPNKS